ncbi:hypothetical protein PVNG_02484 [Plasmodium vivax North Korean]|uniref:Uncharacterized protein n=1 Tax=Plasmodium vivax North Korean TaxID=1035514 RepID=A0A0J9TKW0_PLAVI|nr:hypothetical protein PVNG_02484 [Plasmodium vivax North Korean]
MDGAAFGLMVLKILLGANIGNYYWTHILISFLFAFTVFLLILFLFNSRSTLERQNICTMLILFGLVLNIFFRTATHLIKEYSQVSVNTSFALALGGAENIYELFPHQFLLIQIAIPLTALIFIIVRSLSKHLNLAELGFDQARSLGTNVRLLQVVGYFLILCCNTLTINLAGNISFAGLISTHLSRKILKTRKYQSIIPTSSLISVALLVLAVSINQTFPSVPSSNIILALGSILLLFLSRQ